jgi:phosphatidylserine/phosphatidylglycerophosphate/cardiolipin synthase-like enzyme
MTLKQYPLIPLAALCLLTLLACEKKSSRQPQGEIAVDQAAIQVRFSPGGKPTDLVVDVLDNAKQTVLVQAYSFTSAPIAEALRNAHRRGVNVRVILDKGQRSEKYTSATFLHNAGIPVWIDKKHAIAHNKVMVIDSNIVITGSFNFTKAAESRNAENLLVIRNAEIAKQYIENWNKCRGHAEDY